jgi:hypothetical protein
MFSFTDSLKLFSLNQKKLQRVQNFLLAYGQYLVCAVLIAISIFAFIHFFQNGLGLSYNDARSHLNIGRRVVEGLKPGLAQIGSVWLPLPHILMIPTIWNDYMWHTGLAGSIQSMISYVATGMIIFAFLKRIGVGWVGRLVGVGVFALNLNILYLQSTAMTELLLLATMTIAVYQFLLYYQKESIHHLLWASFWVMLSTLIRYDGWFLFFYCTVLIGLNALKKGGYKMAEGLVVLFCTLGGFGIFLWLLWNTLIFKDPLYFAFGQYSAHAQQEQLDDAGVLITKKNLKQSVVTYWHAMSYNSGLFILVVGLLGALSLWSDKKLDTKSKIATTALGAPLIFNILALYLGHSVLFIQGINGNTWFNVRYGIMMMPSLAIFIGYLVHRVKSLRPVLIGLLMMVLFIQFTSTDAVTIDDGRVGSSQKNVSQVSGWIRDQAADKPGFVLISAASHDAIIFSTGMPMKRFIHEGTGSYWTSATESPDRWARWIVMRTNDDNDQTYRLVKVSGALDKYTLIKSFPFADIYELKEEYLGNLQTEPVFGKQK